MKNGVLFYILTTAVLLTGCTTVRVSKVTNGNETGIRYSLGKPFIQVNPNPSGDGTYTAELVYLPDNNQTYAVSATAFLTKYTLELNVDESGILKKVDLSKGGDSHASDVISATAEIAKSQLEEKKKKADEKEAERKAELKAAKDELAKLEEAIAEKNLQIFAAEQDITAFKKVYGDNPDKPELKEKLQNLLAAKAKLENELTHLKEKLNSSTATVKTLLAANKPAPSTNAEAWGPVMFEIKDDYDTKKNPKGTVALVAVNWPDGNKQMKFETASKVKEPPAPVDAPKITGGGLLLGEFNQNGIAEINFSFDKPILNINKESSSLVRLPQTQFSFQNDASFQHKEMKEFTFRFKKEIVQSGNFKLEIQFAYKTPEGNKNAIATVEFELK